MLRRVDVGSGVFAAVAVNAALLHRERTGEARRIDLAMFDCMLAIMESPITRYLMAGEVLGRMGATHPAIMPFEAFATGDGHVALACGNDRHVSHFCFVRSGHALPSARRRGNSGPPANGTFGTSIHS